MSDCLLATIVFLAAAAIGTVFFIKPSRGVRSPSPHCRRSSGIGTVRAVDGFVTLDVESASGQHFVGRLRRHSGDAPLDDLRPGVLLLVTFDPAERERLSLADDMAAVRRAFDQMLLGKGLVTSAQLELIGNGIRARGIVTAMRTTGTVREDYLEVELDLMVRRASGGQFPAHETALVPKSALAKVAPGSVVDAYYRGDDESSVAVSVSPG